MKNKITQFVKNGFSDDILAVLLKNLEESSGKPFSTKITFSVNIDKTINYEIIKLTLKIPKAGKIQKLEKITSPEIFTAIIEKLKLKNDSHGKSYLALVEKLKKEGEVFFPRNNPQKGDNYSNELLRSCLNQFLLSRGFSCAIKSTGEKRTFALYKVQLT